MSAIRHTSNPLDVFKPLKRRDRVRQAYLHEDGHVLVRFDRYLAGLNKNVGYYKQIDSVGVQCHFKGRIFFGDQNGSALFRVMLKVRVREISARVPTVEQGSEATRKVGVEVGTVAFMAIPGVGEFKHYFNDRIHTGVTYDQWQAETVESFNPELVEYSTENVVETLMFVEKGPL